MTTFEPELDRIRRAYRSRDGDPGIAVRNDPLGAVTLLRLQQRDWIIAALLRRSGVHSLSGLDILEVGCGSGGSLQRLVGLGAEPGRLSGIELVEDRLAEARRRLPTADLRVGSAHQLPYLDASFDAVTQMMVFSSVIEPALRVAIAREMLRVLRPGGRILWYDARGGPRTPDFSPLPLSDLRLLFPGCHVNARAVTLRWALMERLAPRSRLTVQLLERIPALCSHTVAVIRPG